MENFDREKKLAQLDRLQELVSSVRGHEFPAIRQELDNIGTPLDLTNLKREFARSREELKAWDEVESILEGLKVQADFLAEKKAKAIAEVQENFHDNPAEPVRYEPGIDEPRETDEEFVATARGAIAEEEEMPEPESESTSAEETTQLYSVSVEIPGVPPAPPIPGTPLEVTLAAPLNIPAIPDTDAPNAEYVDTVDTPGEE